MAVLALFLHSRDGVLRRNGRSKWPKAGRNAKEIAMSASTIGLASTFRRIKVLQRLPATALLLCAVASSAVEPSKPFLEKNSFYLTSAGFRIQFANDPAGQKALRALPAHRFVTNGAGEATRYLYAEPQHCVCIFVGTQQAYDRYRDLLSHPVKPTDNVPADYKTQSSILLSNQPPRQSTRGDPTTLSDYLSTLR